MEGFDYIGALDFLYSLQKYGIKFGLSKTENLLKGLGDPHRDLKFIHIAGTNGKGSVATYISYILERAGYRVGVYTSPHLVTFRERMRINRKFISPEEVVALTEDIKRVMVEEEPPTFFEAVTAMAMRYFDVKGVDVVVLETGMGGRLDATNVVSPLVGIITNISMEHQEFLGNTLLDIAGEKAGIIKEAIPLISGASQKEVRLLFEKICKEKRSPLYLFDRDFTCIASRKSFSYYGVNNSYEGLVSGLAGRFQRYNMALALCCIELLGEYGFVAKEEHIRHGLKEAFWPGRLHVVSHSPLVVVDGAHNRAAMETLISTLEEMEFERLVAVVGIMEDKDIEGMMGRLVPLCDTVIFSRPRYFRAMDPYRLMKISPPACSSYVVPSLHQAIDRAFEVASSGDLILITGSLFTVGEALSILDPQTYPPEDV